MTPRSQIVIVTGLELTGLQENIHGVYQRFRILLEAATEAASSVTVLCIHQRVQDAARDPVAEQEVASMWELTVRVVSSPCRFPPSRAWFVEQLAGAVDYRWAYGFRGLNSAASRSMLAGFLEAGALAVVAHRLPMMEFVSPLVPPGIPIIFDLDDIEHVALKRASSLESSLRHKLLGFLSIPSVRRAEARAIARARYSLVCSEHDKLLLDGSLARNGGEVVVLPNTVEIRARQPIARAPTLMFVGVLSWHPNAEALNFFLDECWPGILEQRSDARLLVVGKDPEAIRCFRRPPDGVEFLGFVPDIATMYADARAVICPVQSGGGTRVKLVEAAAFGKPIVSTTIGAEGLAFRHGVEALLADSPQDFVESCLRILADDSLAEALSVAAHAHAEARFSRASARQRLVTMMTRPGPPAERPNLLA